MNVPSINQSIAVLSVILIHFGNFFEVLSVNPKLDIYHTNTLNLRIKEHYVLVRELESSMGKI